MFLDEDFSKVNVENLGRRKMNTDEYLQSIFVDCSCFNESLSLSECAYNNLIIDCMKEEYNASLNEGIASKFLDSIRGFFSKMNIWIRARYRDLDNFTKKTLVKMKRVFGLISEFAIKQEERIIEGAKTKEAVAKTYDWYPRLLKLTDLYKSLSRLNFSDEFEKIIDDSKKFISSYFKSENIVETKITPELAKIAIENAKNSNDVEKIIKEYVAKAEEALHETEDASNKGTKNKDEKEIIVSKQNVENGKKKILTSSKKCSILINLANKAIIDSHRINVACASMYTGN